MVWESKQSWTGLFFSKRRWASVLLMAMCSLLSERHCARYVRSRSFERHHGDHLTSAHTSRYLPMNIMVVSSKWRATIQVAPSGPFTDGCSQVSRGCRYLDDNQHISTFLRDGHNFLLHWLAKLFMRRLWRLGKHKKASSRPLSCWSSSSAISISRTYSWHSASALAGSRLLMAPSSCSNRCFSKHLPAPLPARLTELSKPNGLMIMDAGNAAATRPPGLL